jgi:hypothetical protein
MNVGPTAELAHKKLPVEHDAGFGSWKSSLALKKRLFPNRSA